MTGYEGSHQDWLEGQASDRLEREEYERAKRRGWTVTTSEFASKDILITARKRGIVFEFTHDQAVTFAHAILAEVEIATRQECDRCGTTTGEFFRDDGLFFCIDQRACDVRRTPSRCHEHGVRGTRCTLPAAHPEDCEFE